VQTNRHIIERSGGVARKRLPGYAGILMVAILAAFLLKTFVIGAICVPSGSMETTLLPGDFVLINKLVYGARTSAKLPFTESRFSELRIPGLRKISRGDVIVFSFPGDPDGSSPDDPVYFVKRCIAKGRDKIEINHGVCYVNDEQLQELRIPNEGAGSAGDQFGPVIVPARGDTIALTPANISAWEVLIRREGHDVRFGGPTGVTIDGIPAKKYGFEKNYLFVLGDNRERSYDSRAWGFLPEENVIGEAMMVYWSAPEEHSGSGAVDALQSIRWDRIGMFVR
jgi:signal peptidase I